MHDKTVKKKKKKNNDDYLWGELCIEDGFKVFLKDTSNILFLNCRA